MSLQPRRILDAGTGTGLASLGLLERYGGAEVIGLDLAHGMLLQSRARQNPEHRWPLLCADIAALPLADHSVDLIFSNLALQWCRDPGQVFREFRRVLAPGGLLTFATLGPDTLQELRASWAGVDQYSHVNRFIDMHDLGDGLMQAAMADPVMDAEHFVLSYATVRDLMRDLKAIGAHNVTAGRPRGLMGKERFRNVERNYENFRRDGRLPATYEVIYGHAWGPETSSPAGGGPGSEGHEVAIPIGGIGRRDGGPVS